MAGFTQGDFTDDLWNAQTREFIKSVAIMPKKGN